MMNAPETTFPKTILVVDDEPETAKMLATMLGLYGFEVQKAHGPAKAIQIIQKQLPDLLLLDVMMPGVSGLELCRYLRREPRYQNIPIIIISARSQPEDIEEGMAAGASMYLTKPITMKVLIKTVQDALLPKTYSHEMW